MYDNQNRKLIWKSHKINKPEINLISDLRHTIINYYMTESPNEYIIKMNKALLDVIKKEMIDLELPIMVKGIKCVEDNLIEDGIYCVYRKCKSIPIELTPVKTLNEWFANLPLIYKLDLYNSYTGVITKHLMQKGRELLNDS